MSSGPLPGRAEVVRSLSRLGLIGLTFVGVPTRVGAQSLASDSVVGAPAQEEKPERGGFSIRGKAPDRRRFIFAIGAMHPFDPQFPEVDWTRGLGVQFSTWFGATLINSYGKRTFAAGVERDWFTGRWKAVRFGTGFRVGLVTGYDERLFALAGYTPVLPFGGLLVWTRVGAVGLDAFYVYRTITVEGSLGF
jgi:hypothetical protein